jgi:flagellar biosynthesis/type III secretory pathway protein FliH
VTALIKKDAALSGEGVVPLQWRPLDDGRAHGDELTPDPAIAALQTRIAELDQALLDSEEARADAVARAREEGRKEAEDNHRRDEAAALAALQAAIAQAQDSLSRRLADLDALALVLCENALATVFSRFDDYQERTSRALELQLAGLRNDILLCVFVSPEDFPHSEALETLRRRIGKIDIVQDGSLGRGEARLDLRLGHIELSLDAHWDAIRKRLVALAGGGAPL